MNYSVRTFTSMPSAGSASRLAGASQAALQKLSRASRAALQNLPRAWQRWTTLRHVRETDAVWVNDHLVRDVGVVDARTARAERETLSRVFHADPRSLLAAALVATAVQAWACDTTAPGQSGTRAANAPMVGVFSGEFVNGAPVYRLPPIAVVASRKALAEQAPENGIVRAKQARAKAAAKPPA
jgi:hypothetical protein